MLVIRGSVLVVQMLWDPYRRTFSDEFLKLVSKCFQCLAPIPQTNDFYLAISAQKATNFLLNNI